MKHTNKKTAKQRLLTIGALLLVILLTFSACGGGKKKETLIIEGAISPIDGGALTGDEMKIVATMVAASYDASEFDVRDLLIAASRGHNMLAEGFDDTKIDPNSKGNADPVVTAQHVLHKANERVKAADKIGDGLIDKMNALDLQRLIEVFQTKVDVEAKGGLWDKILTFVGKCLNWMTRYLGFGSYIVGICIFAVIWEILMLPFSIKQQKNTIRQAQLRPKEMAIRNKYKGRNDQPTMQKMQKEIQDLYARENYSPYSGCFQLLLQFPILIALYNIVIDPLHYVLGQASGVSAALNSYYTAARAAGGLGMAVQNTNSTIGLLSGGGLGAFEGIQNFAYFSNGSQIWESINGLQTPNFNIFGLNFGYNPGLERPWLLLVPVLTFVVYFFSMRLSRKFSYQAMQQGDANDRQVACSNTMMDVSMPAMSTFFAFMVPAIIGVYWMFRSVVGTAKQFILSRVMPLPKFSDEDYKKAAKEMAGKAPKVVKSERVGTVRSLHHIDDEDFEDTRERALAQKEAMERAAREEQEKKAKNTPFDAPELKDDRASESEKTQNEED